MISDMVMNERLRRSISGKKRELDRHRPFSAAVLRRLTEEFALEWTYNSNAIEGNTLSLRETELVMNKGLTIGGKTLREHFEVVNHAEAIACLEGFIQRKVDLSEEFIRKLHRIILKNIDDREAGAYRRHTVRIVGATDLPPRATKVRGLVSDLIGWYEQHAHLKPIPELAAKMHYRFVHIHPFMDGNGRTARLLMNFILMRNGYPPAVILHVDRRKYYRVLQQADSGDKAPFSDFIGRSVERSLIIYLNALQPDDGRRKESGYISLRDAAAICDYSQEYLSFLARTGRLDAVKFRRNWMTSREAIDAYIESVQPAAT